MGDSHWTEEIKDDKAKASHAYENNRGKGS